MRLRGGEENKGEKDRKRWGGGWRMEGGVFSLSDRLMKLTLQIRRAEEGTCNGSRVGINVHVRA